MTLTIAGEHPPRAGRTVLRAVGALLLGLLFALGAGVAPAQAHAELLSTNPEDGAVLDTAPATVELRFNEPVQLIEDAIRLFPGDGDPVVLTARTVDTTVTIALPDELGEGAYALAYRVVSADGHPIGGALTFQVGDGDYTVPDTSAAPADPVMTDTIVSILTVAQYLGLLLLAGLLCFDRIVLCRAEIPGPGTRRILRYAIGLAVAASLLLIPASGSRVTGHEFITYLPESGDLVLLPASTWMPGVSWQLLAAAALVTVLGIAATILESRTRGVAGRARALGCAALALAAPLLVGHTQTVQPVWVMLAADCGHLVAGAFWLGGVVGLLLYLRAARPAVRGGRPRIPPRETAEVVARFSRFALYSVILLAVSGTVMAVLIVGSWQALVSSGYGLLLTIKLIIVGAVIAVAAWNRTDLLPRITRHPADERQWVSLRRTLTVEAILLVAVLAVTGFLTNTSPTTTPEHSHGTETTAPTEQETPVHAESQGLTVDGTITPAATGKNTVTFRLEYKGEPITTEDVTVEARLPEQELGPFTATPQLDPATGEYEAALTMPVAGEWQIQVTTRIDTYTQPIAMIPVTVR
ncbi:copper resistance CopC/CopD family protein [Mycetocola reblochoni]|uniref:copper resistance CopC/CopD family protein n=1 Tax=Microbacteriaceae TaxID=85023 RepID=UPI003F9B8536